MPYQYKQPIQISSFGQPPLVVDSTALVTSLNADLLDGQHGSFYQNADNLNAGNVPVERGRDPASTSKGVIKHNGDTLANGQFYTGSTNPNNSATRYNFNGAFHAMRIKAHDYFEGNGANLTALNANELASGRVPLARLGTNTPSAGQFLAHDNSWKTPASGGVSGHVFDPWNLPVVNGSGYDQVRVIHNLGTIHVQLQYLVNWAPFGMVQAVPLLYTAAFTGLEIYDENEVRIWFWENPGDPGDGLNVPGEGDSRLYIIPITI